MYILAGTILIGRTPASPEERSGFGLALLGIAAADNRGTARRFIMDSERRQTDNTSGDRNGGWNLKQYVVIALVVFITFCCCILFFFMIYRYNGFADFWKKLTTILQPIIMGLVLAYLLNPVMKFLERHLMKLLEPRMKSKTKAKKMSRGVAIAGAWVFLGGIVVLLIAAIVPSIIQSIPVSYTHLTLADE